MNAGERDAVVPGRLPGRPARADTRRNLDRLVEAAKAVFAEDGIDAPVRSVARRAGVGIATVYRHFPTRAELVAAVFYREVDACAAAAGDLARTHAPGDAVVRWLHRYVAFIETKRGLAAAIHSGDPTFAGLPAYFDAHLRPALRGLLDAAAAAGEMRGDVDAGSLLAGMAKLAIKARLGDDDVLLQLVLDGLRFVARVETASGPH